MNFSKEIKYYGHQASLHLFKNRKEDIIRVYLENTKISSFAHLLKWCSTEKKAYHIVTSLEMEKITESVHHEGICILAKEKKKIPFEALLKSPLERSCLIYLDGVQNPHNLGSVLRVCSHFGITHILGKNNELPSLSPSAYRISQGGAEYVSLITLNDPEKEILLLKEKGFTFFATSSHAKKSLYQQKLPHKTLFIFGAEDKGVSENFKKIADDLLLIPGVGNMGSLNVSHAITICLSEYFHQNRAH
jgi:TrmH RNA methyltransferase